MKASWICAALLALTCTLRQGSAQNVPCFTSLGCNDATGGVGNLATIPDCCGMIDTLTYRPTEDSESCLSCYAFGWVTNIADDLSRAEVQPDILMASEGQTITLTLFMVKNIPPNTLRFNFVIESSGSATEGDDYTITPESTSPTLPANIVFSRVPVQVNVTLLNDGVAGEGQEDVRITLVQETESTPIEGNRVLIRDSVLITFQDNDIMSGFSVDAITITEGGVESVCLQTVGTPATDSVLTVAVVFGTAGPTDFNLITTSLTITPTLTVPCVDFEALMDNLGLEDQETVTLVLSGPSNVQLTSPNLTITIEDADIVEFGFFATEVEGDEGSGEIIVTITRSVATALPMSFTLTPIEYNVSYGLSKPDSDPRSPNRATAGADFPTDVIQFTILPGSDSVVVSVPINDDNIAEDSEQCFIGILRFQGFDAGATLGTDVTQLGILDDESAKIEFESIILSFDEGDVDITYGVNITRDIESEQTYSVGLSSSPRTAEVEDYSVPEGPYDFPPDVSTITVPVTITGDTRIEWGERFDVTLSQRGGPPFDMLGDGVRTTTTIGINDNDGDYMYVPEQAIYDVTEGEQTQVRFVLLNPPPDGVFEFDFNITLSTADGSAIEGADYIRVVGEVIQASRMPNGTVTTTVAALDDDVVETEEGFVVMGQVTPTGLPVVFNSAASVAIIDNDKANLRFDRTFDSTAEGRDISVCLLPVQETLEASITVVLSAQSGSATEGTDFVADDQVVVITGGSGEIPGCIIIESLVDRELEGDELLTVVADVTTNADLVEFPDGNRIDITITDISVLLSLEQSVYQVSEDDDSVDVCVVVTEGTVIDSTPFIVLSIPDTAVGGSDYMRLNDILTDELLFGETRKCVAFTIISDGVIEDAESFNVSLTTDAEFASLVNTVAVVNIAGELAEIRFEQGMYAGMEGDNIEVCVVVENGVLENDLTVPIVILPSSTATELEDFQLSSSEVVIPANSARGCLTVSLIESTVVEGEEVIRLSISSIVDATVTGETTTIVIAVDGDVAVGFRDVGYTVLEGDSVGLVVQKSGIFDSDIEFQVTTGDGMFVGGGTFPAGGTEFETLIDITFFAPDNDVALEDDVIVSMNLSLVTVSPQIVLMNGVIPVTIQDNDGPVVVGFDEPGLIVGEESGTLFILVSVNQQIDSDVTVNVAVIEGSATEREDYFRTGSSELVFTSNETMSVLVSIADDDIIEETESFTIVLSNPQPAGGVVLGIDTFTVTIIDQDFPVISFADSEYLTSEMFRGQQVCVEVANGILVEDLEVDIDLLDSSTATEGDDFDFAVGPSIVIPAGSNVSCLEISIIPSDVTEPAEVINLAINTTTTVAVFGPILETTVVIQSDGVVTVGFEQAEYTQFEGQLVEIVVVKSGSVDSDINFEVIGNGITLPGSFFIGNRSAVLFNIPDDRVALEPPEEIALSLVLIDPSPLVVLGLDRTTITVIDDDGPVTVGFALTEILVEENRGILMVPVSLDQPVAVPISVDIMYVTDTASVDDFVRTGQSQLTFTSDGTQNILVGIIDDDISEQTEAFSISLVNPQPVGSVLAFPDRITITIIDDDDEITTLVNNTVVGDPFYTAPIFVQDSPPSLGTPASLCYEIHGEEELTFNLVNDFCTLVNAHYTGAVDGLDVNVIDRLSIRAVDSADECHNIAVSLDGGCSVSVDGEPVDRYGRNDISVTRHTGSGQPRVRVSVPNCDKIMFVMWMICEQRPLPATDDIAVSMIKFVIARGLSITQSAHGLLGQMFNVPFTVVDYGGLLDSLDPSTNHYYVTVGNTLEDSASSRTFVASLQLRSWDRTAGPCLYAGNRQSGPTGDIPEDQRPNDSVIEGEYTQYAVDGDFGSDCMFCGQFDESKCAA